VANKQQAEESGGESVGLWYVSFADMITLLLAFFVMLATFSSFDSGSISKLENVGQSIARDSIFAGNSEKGGMLPPPDRVVDWTERGSEKPTDADPALVRSPKERDWSAEMVVAYSSRREIQLPSAQMFYGQGAVLTAAGQRHLKLIGSFVRMLPCRVLVAERMPPAEDGSTIARSLDRAWTVLDFIMKEQKLPAEQCGIYVASTGAKHKGVDEPMIEIVLLAKELTQ
jgi:chemotaxis protein MotB